MIISPKEKLLTQTIPRSNSNLDKPQAQPLTIQLVDAESSIGFTHRQPSKEMSETDSQLTDTEQLSLTCTFRCLKLLIGDIQNKNDFIYRVMKSPGMFGVKFSSFGAAQRKLSKKIQENMSQQQKSKM